MQEKKDQPVPGDTGEKKQWPGDEAGKQGGQGDIGKKGGGDVGDKGRCRAPRRSSNAVEGSAQASG